MGLLRAVATVGGLTLISRILGFLRDILIARFLGAGLVADVFVIALQLPNLFRRLFGEGAFANVFVPMFARFLELNGKAHARLFAEQVLAVLLPLLLLIVVGFQAGMAGVIQVIAPGFAEDPEKFALAVTLTRLTMPYLLFICLVALFGGVLNSLGRFGAMAATPILFNLTLIAAAACGSLLLPEKIGHALSLGVTLSGMIQLLWMLGWAKRQGMLLALPRPRLTPEVKRLLVLLGPAVLSQGVLQLNQVLSSVLGSFLQEGAIAYLYYADRVSQLPLGVVGVAVATALLPRLTAALRGGRLEEAESNQNRALEFTLLLTLPATVALVVIALPVISVLFERGAFGPEDSLATANTLVMAGLGLPAYVLLKVFQTGFFAREDTKTPFYASVASILVYLVAALALMGPFSFVGLAAATAIAAWVNVGTLVWLQAKRGFLHLDKRLHRVAPRILLASLIMGAVLWVIEAPVMGLLGGAYARYGGLALLVLAGLGAYGIAVLATGAARPADIKAMLRRSRG